MIKAWSAVGDGAGGYSLTTTEVADPAYGEVVVDLKSSGVCHTDRDGLNFTRVPHVMGHEGAGIVRAVGEGVRKIEPGQRVLLTWAIACLDCFQCQRGNETLCETLGREHGAASSCSTLDSNGQNLSRFFNLGTMSTVTVVRQEAIVPLPDGIPFESACLLGCAVMTGYGSVVNAAKVETASTVAVIGCGGVGLNVIQGARISGARRIIAVDVNQERFDMARKFGATDFVLASRDDPGLLKASSEVANLLEGRGADYAFECTAIPDLGVAPLSFVRNAGTAVQVSGVEQVVPVDMELFEWDKLYLNPLYGKVRPRIDFPILFDLYLRDQLLLDELVTATYELNDLDKAFDDMLAGRNAKGVIVFE